MPEGMADDMRTHYEPSDFKALRERIEHSIGGKVEAPFTVEQVNSLNDYQRSGAMHPFTCMRDPRLDHSDGEGVLVARRDGWMCPDDDYTQTWAHAFMVDRSWESHVASLRDLLTADSS